MNKKEVTGTIEQIQGKVMQGVGKVTGNQNTQARGKAEENKGKVTKVTGQIDAKLVSATNDVKAKFRKAAK